MNDHPYQPKDPGARKGLLNEALLCDLIEGQLSDERAASTREVLARDAVLMDTIAQMEHDRAVLRSLGEEPAPGDLFAQLEPVLEREMLLNHSGHDSGIMDPPALRKSQPVVVHRTSSWKIPALVFSSAAAIVVVTGVVIFAQMLVARMPVNATRMAQDQTPTPTDPVMTAPEQVEQSTTLAENTTPVEEHIPQVLPLVDRPREALALAREGRLLMRVAAQEPGGSATVMMASMRQSPDRSWSIQFPGTTSPGGVVMCRFEPRVSVLNDLAANLREAGLLVSLEEAEASAADPLSAREIVWWRQRSTWEVQSVTLPIVLED